MAQVRVRGHAAFVDDMSISSASAIGSSWHTVVDFRADFSMFSHRQSPKRAVALAEWSATKQSHSGEKRWNQSDSNRPSAAG